MFKSFALEARSYFRITVIVLGIALFLQHFGLCLIMYSKIRLIFTEEDLFTKKLTEFDWRYHVSAANHAVATVLSFIVVVLIAGLNRYNRYVKRALLLSLCLYLCSMLIQSLNEDLDVQSSTIGRNPVGFQGDTMPGYMFAWMVLGLVYHDHVFLPVLTDSNKMVISYLAILLFNIGINQMTTFSRLLDQKSDFENLQDCLIDGIKSTCLDVSYTNLAIASTGILSVTVIVFLWVLILPWTQRPIFCILGSVCSQAGCITFLVFAFKVLSKVSEGIDFGSFKIESDTQTKVGGISIVISNYLLLSTSTLTYLQLRFQDNYRTETMLGRKTSALQNLSGGKSIGGWDNPAAEGAYQPPAEPPRSLREEIDKRDPNAEARM